MTVTDPPLTVSRRQALGALAAATLTAPMAWRSAAAAETSRRRVLRFAHLPDVHLQPELRAVEGLAFSWGALMGFAVMLGRIDPAALVLYAGSIAWVIGYDTVYAHQDAEDDALIGVKSTARLFGARTHLALWVFYSLAVVLIGVALALSAARWPAWIGLVAFAAHLVWQIRRLDISDPALCLRIFKSNRDAGLLLFAGLLVDALMR